MKVVFLICFLLLGFLSLNSVGSGINGGKSCAVCTIAVGWLKQVVEVHNKTESNAVEILCDLLPEDLGWLDVCKTLAASLGPTISILFQQNKTADFICHAINICYTEPGTQECHLFPKPEGGIKNDLNENRLQIKMFRYKHGLNKLGPRKDICDFPGFNILCDMIKRVSGKLPAVDIDKDGFSTIKTLRGTSWRGKDCNDLLSSFYPGRKPINSDRHSDSNCNGIYGQNMDGEAYEDIYCANSKPLGVAVFGDSASALFHIPLEWISPELVNKEAFSYLPFVIANEFDWPMMSAITGHENLTWPIVHDTTYSIYERLVERNRCNHRDYQSISYNGASTSSMLKYQSVLSRSQKDDHPMLVFYSLIGNDVCRNHMTTPEKLQENLNRTLEYLESTLPAGSHVFIIGIGDGRILFNSLTGRIHPFGSLHGDITYDNFYDYMNCLQISPCEGWMQTNQTIRDLTAERQKELNIVLERMAKAADYSNFDVHYEGDLIYIVMSEWERKHGKGSSWMLIDPVDGFHPNQRFQTLAAEHLWENILKKDISLGKINPYNENILALFGDQGGN